MPKPHLSLQGRLLLDGGKLRGSYFHRTVVLVCQHDPKGAFGLVLNRPSDNPLGDVLEADLSPAFRDQRLFGGGPVQPAAMSFLICEPGVAQPHVLPDLTVGHDLERLVELTHRPTPPDRLRVFAGYAGWAPGQLDEEMRRDSWLVHPGSPELVFHTPPEALWRHILQLKGDWQSRLLADSPEDLSWN